MEERIRDAFDAIHASERLKRDVKAEIRRKTLNYGRDLMRRQRRRRLAGGLVSLALAMTAWGLWQIPVTSIGLDVNPSLEIRVNSLDRVIDVKGCNLDGDAVADGFCLRGLPYGDAMQRILVSDTMAPYLESNSTVVITVSGGNSDHTQQMLNNVVCRAYALTEEEQVFCVRSDGATARAARSVGLSVARYQAWQVLLLENPTLPPEAALELTVDQIRELIHGETLDDPCEK